MKFVDKISVKNDTYEIHDTAARNLITETGNQVGELQADVQLLDAQMDLANSGIKSLKDKVTTIENKQVTDEANIYQNTTDIANIKPRVSEVEAVSTQNQADIVNMKSRLTTAENTLTTVNDSIDVINAVNKQQTSQININKNDIAGLKTRMSAAEDDIADIHTDIDDLDERITASTYEAGIGIYFGQGEEHTNINVEDELIDKINEVDELDERVTAAEKNINTINNDIKDIKGDITDIQGDITNINSNISTINNNITRINGDITDIKGDITDIKGDITNINNNITRVNGDITDIKGDITNINSNITTINGDITDMSDEITDMKGDITKLQGDVSDIQSDMGGIQTDLTTAQGDIKALQGDVTNIKSDIGDLQTDMTTAQGDITKLQGDVSDIQSDIGDLQNDMTTAQGDITALQGDVSSIQSDIGDLQTDMTTAQGDITALQDKTNVRYVYFTSTSTDPYILTTSATITELTNILADFKAGYQVRGIIDGPVSTNYDAPVMIMTAGDRGSAGAGSMIFSCEEYHSNIDNLQYNIIVTWNNSSVQVDTKLVRPFNRSFELISNSYVFNNLKIRTAEQAEELYLEASTQNRDDRYFNVFTVLVIFGSSFQWATAQVTYNTFTKNVTAVIPVEFPTGNAQRGTVVMNIDPSYNVTYEYRREDRIYADEYTSETSHAALYNTTSGNFTDLDNAPIGIFRVNTYNKPTNMPSDITPSIAHYIYVETYAPKDQETNTIGTVNKIQKCYDLSTAGVGTFYQRMKVGTSEWSSWYKFTGTVVT